MHTIILLQNSSTEKIMRNMTYHVNYAYSQLVAFFTHPVSSEYFEMIMN